MPVMGKANLTIRS